jgi:hypothetical protein
MSSCVHNLFEKMSCALNLYIKKIVKRGKLEKKGNEKTPRGGAGGRRGARATARHIGFAGSSPAAALLQKTGTVNHRWNTLQSMNSGTQHAVFIVIIIKGYSYLCEISFNMMHQ